MSAETEFRAALASHTPLTALVGNRIALHAIEQGQQMPYVVFASRHDPQYTLDNTLAADIVTFEVQCWAETAVQAAAVASAVQSAASAAGCVVTQRSGAFDPDVGLDAENLTIEWID